MGSKTWKTKISGVGSFTPKPTQIDPCSPLVLASVGRFCKFFFRDNELKGNLYFDLYTFSH